MRHLLSSLLCTLDVVAVSAAILKGVAHLELDAIFLVASKVLLTRGRGTIRTVDGVITYLRSAEKSLVDLSEHN